MVAVCQDMQLKKFQREDYARIALHDGAILGHDTGLGKTIALFLWPLLKVGWLKVLADGHQSLNESRLRPAKPVLLVVPGDGHDQTDDESQKHFKTKAIRLDSQETFLKLSKLQTNGGRIARCLPPHYYLTSYTQLAGNGVIPFPALDRAHPERTMAALRLPESDVADWFNRRAEIYRREYALLNATPETPCHQLEAVWQAKRHEFRNNQDYQQTLDKAYELLRQFTLQRKTLSPEQWRFVRAEFAAAHHARLSSALDSSRNGIKCIYSPSLADLCQDCFGAIVIDEGTKIKGEETIISLGVRQINAPYRLVMSATPIKNRFPDVFRLAHYVCGGHAEPTPRFPYGDYDRDSFAEQFQVSEVLADNKHKRRHKLTPQVCNVHRAWKLLAPIILRRRKDNCGEDIVPKLRHVVRVPMGLSQAATYQFHLAASYLDKNGRPAIGAQLQALRIAAANPASQLLRSDGRSQYDYIPKVATILSLIQQTLERGEQAIVFGAFNDSLDVVSARLREAGVKHLVLDGRTSQTKRGQLMRQFKLGSPRAFREGLTSRHSDYAVALLGPCAAELHSLPLCNNAILGSFDWAHDILEQVVNRIHRLNSPWPVNLWSVICQGSIDYKLEANLHEKSDAAELVLDGHLLGETPAEVNLAELLHSAHREFNRVKTLDEVELEKGWPRLRAALGKAFNQWNCNPASLLPSAIAPVQSASLPLPRFTVVPFWRQSLSRR